METTTTTSVQITDQDVTKGETLTLTSPTNPTPTETVYLSNIDQTVVFPVETIFFFESSSSPMETSTVDIVERVRAAVSGVLLTSYYFMAGRLTLNPTTGRLELVCNNAGVPFAGATSGLQLKDLGDVSLPNPSFRRLIVGTDGFGGLEETPIFTIQVTRFRCGGFSVGFVTNHSILDGRSAAEMFENLASICRRGNGTKIPATAAAAAGVLRNDRTFIHARDPPLILYEHPEYTELSDPSSASSSFTSSMYPSPRPSPHPSKEELLLSAEKQHVSKVFTFTPDMITTLKHKALAKCSTFEALVAHIWRARTKAVFEDPCGVSSVLFAVDIRSRMSPPLPDGFVGNAVITASASAKVVDLEEKPFSFCVEMVMAAKGRVTDEYVRSVIDWLEVHRGVPSTFNGNFFVSAWWKLPFHELDFGFGRPLFGGPVAGLMDEFVLLLSNGKDRKEGGGGGINVWVVLEREKMERFMGLVFEM